MFDRRTLPLSALRAFEAAGRQLHLGRAGEELGVTHGAISHQLKNLEAYLGVPLFDRAGRRLQLTPFGERLLHQVEAGFDQIVDGLLHLDPDELAGRLTIACTPTTAASWAVRQISEFQLAYPSMDIHLVEISPNQRNIPREVDVAICFGKPSPGGRKLELLAEPQLYPVCSPALLHGKPAVTRPEHLAGFTLLHDDQNRWEDWFHTANAPPPEQGPGIHFYSAHLAHVAARQGYGVALCNPFEIQEDLSRGRLMKLLNHTIPESHSYFILTNPGDRQPLRSRVFEEWLKRVVTENLAYE